MIVNRMQQARDLMLSQAELLNNPEVIPTFIRESLKGLTTQVTPEMQGWLCRLFDRQLDGEDATALYKEMIAAPAGTYDPPRTSKRCSASLRQGGQIRITTESGNRLTTQNSTQADIYDVGFANYQAVHRLKR